MRLRVIICSMGIFIGSILSFLPSIYAGADAKTENEYTPNVVGKGKKNESSATLDKAKSKFSITNQEVDANSEQSAESQKNKWFVIYGDVGFVSNYLYRGFTETFGMAAVQGQIVIAQKKDEGFFAGMWGSNVDGTTAANGSGLELLIFGGHIYKVNKDLSLKLELRDTHYPGASNPSETKDTFDMFEIIPGFTYKYFTFYWAYQVTNVSGVNQNFVQGFGPATINPQGNTKGSSYVEGSIDYPIPHTEEKLKLKLIAGYWYIRNYPMLNYAYFGIGLSYKIPEKYAGLIFSANATTTTGQKKYYTNVNVSGRTKAIPSSTIWFGVKKEF